ELWENGCQMIKTLKALQYFVLVPHFFGVVYIPMSLVKSLEPLKDLRLKDQWELRISDEDNEVIETALVEAGFDCFITYDPMLGLPHGETDHLPEPTGRPP